MKFAIVKNNINEKSGTFVPNIVFDSLYETRESELKVALYAIEKHEADPAEIAQNLSLSLNLVISAMQYWTDKGLFICTVEDAPKKKKKVPLTGEAVAKLSKNPDIIALTRGLQKVFGQPLSEKYTNAFIALYAEEGIPVDVILQICQHHISTGIDNPAYIIKVVRSWFSKLGLTTGDAVDKYLEICIKREKVYTQVCKIFGLDIAKLKSSEKTLIDRWQEKLNMNMDMIEESYVRAGHLANIPYCNGILKAWSQKGYKTPGDLAGEISNISQSLKNIDNHVDLIAQSVKNFSKDK